MSISVQCPKCHKGFKVAEEFAGRQATCAACKTPFRIPGPPPAAAGATRPAAAPEGLKRTSGLKPAPAPLPEPPKRTSGLKPPLPAPPPPPTVRPPGATASSRPAPAPTARPAPANAPAGKAPAPPPPPNPAKPPAAAPAVPQGPTIDFQCSWCDATIKVGLELEGRQTPCPECKRIIKVPLQTKQQPKDWRKVGDGRPSGARRDGETAPAGAWGTDTSASNVSRQALMEAGAMEEEREPATIGQRLKQIVAIAAVVAIVGGAFFWVKSYWALSDRDRAVNKVLAVMYPADGAKPPLGPEAAAEIHRALGELYWTAGVPMPEQALFQYRAARGSVADKYENPTQEREAVLIDVALGIVELGGDKEQVKNRTHLAWSEVLAELRGTMEALRSPEARAEAIRRLAAKLMSKKQDPAVLAGGLHLEDKVEALAIIGLERWRANQLEEAEAAAKAAQDRYDQALKEAKSEKRPLPVAPSLVALYFLLKQPEKNKPFESGDHRGAFALNAGMVESQVRQGQLDGVRAWSKGPMEDTLDRVRAQALLAALSLEKDPKSTDDLDTLLTTLEATQPDQLVELLPTGKPNLSWFLWRVVRLAALGGHDDKAKKLADIIPDASLRGRAQLETLRAKLARSTSKSDDTAADAVEKTALGPAKEALARHNARYGGMSLKTVDAWPDELKPFGWIGIALGIQEK